jgi:hypothetical protein
VEHRPKLPRALVFAFAIAFLFETWVWNNIVAALRVIAAVVHWASIRQALTRLIDRAPVWVALLLFGVPFLVSELGSFFCVALVAIGQVKAGAIGYVLSKLLGLTVLAVIFDITRAKLMTLRWFAYLYHWAMVFHRFAEELVAPYRAVVRAYFVAWRTHMRAYVARRLGDAEKKAG